MKKILLLLMGLLLCERVYAYNCKIEPQGDWEDSTYREQAIQYEYSCKYKKAHGYQENVDVLNNLEYMLTYGDSSNYKIDVDKLTQKVKLDLLYNQMGYVISSEEVRNNFYDRYVEDIDNYYLGLWDRCKIMLDLKPAQQVTFAARIVKLTYVLDAYGYLNNYKAIDIFESYMLSLMRYTTSETAFKMLYAKAVNISDVHYNKKCTYYPGHVVELAKIIAKKKSFQL